MGLFYQVSDLTVYSFAALLIYTFALLGIGELARKNLKTGVFVFCIVPLFLLIFVWPNSSDNSVMEWFVIAKLIAILAFSWIILALRFSKKAQSIPWFKYLVPLLLIINIMEAVTRDFQIYTLDPGIYSSVYVYGGGWNIANGVAGIINILLISGATGIYISRDKSKTMMWPDQLFWWLIAYDVWNFAFIYNNAGDRSFLMISALFAATLATVFFRKGAWMQHRVYTLAINMMFLMTIPIFFLSSDVAVQASRNPAANWTLSLLSLSLNVGLLIYQLYRMKTKKRNSVTGEVYYDSKEYLKIMEEEKLRENSEIADF